MATPAERQAMIIIGAVALLGGVVRLWRAYPWLHPAPHPHAVAGDPMDSDGGEGAPRPDVRHTRHIAAYRSARRPSRNDRSKWARPVDPASIIDLDRATVAQIESLGVLRPGVAQLIVTNRDSCGPFGSMREVERIRFLSGSDLRALAPRVTFSLLPRPKNAVINRCAGPPLGRRERGRPKQGDSS